MEYSLHANGPMFFWDGEIKLVIQWQNCVDVAAGH